MADINIHNGTRALFMIPYLMYDLYESINGQEEKPKTNHMKGKLWKTENKITMSILAIRKVFLGISTKLWKTASQQKCHCIIFIRNI